MEISNIREAKTIKVMLVGNVDEKGAEKMKNAFASLDLKGIETVIVSFEQVSYIGSSGIGKLLLFYKNIGIQSITLQVVGVSSAIHDLFVELKLDTIFHVAKAKG